MRFMIGKGSGLVCAAGMLLVLGMLGASEAQDAPAESPPEQLAAVDYWIDSARWSTRFVDEEPSPRIEITFQVRMPGPGYEISFDGVHEPDSAGRIRADVTVTAPEDAADDAQVLESVRVVLEPEFVAKLKRRNYMIELWRRNGESDEHSLRDTYHVRAH
jgi:hypothetical protein